MVPFRRIVVPGFFITWPWRLGWVRLFAQAKEPGTRPMCPGNPLGNHGQRPIALAVVFEPVLAREDGMSVSAPLPHQGRAGLQHNVGIERTSAFLELCRQSPKAALQGAARAPMGALLQLIGEPPDDQIATEAQGRASQRVVVWTETGGRLARVLASRCYVDRRSHTGLRMFLDTSEPFTTRP